MMQGAFVFHVALIGGVRCLSEAFLRGGPSPILELAMLAMLVNFSQSTVWGLEMTCHKLCPGHGLEGGKRVLGRPWFGPRAICARPQVISFETDHGFKGTCNEKYCANIICLEVGQAGGLCGVPLISAAM